MTTVRGRYQERREEVNTVCVQTLILFVLTLHVLVSYIDCRSSCMRL